MEWDGGKLRAGILERDVISIVSYRLAIWTPWSLADACVPDGIICSGAMDAAIMACPRLLRGSSFVLKSCP